MEHKTADVNALSIKQLKALIGAAGLSTAGCVEKSDLRAKATEAQQRLASVPSTPQTPGAQGSDVRAAGLPQNVPNWPEGRSHTLNLCEVFWLASGLTGR